MHPSFIERLRNLPTHQRHVILWSGSLVVFVMVSWLWLYQVRIELASLAPLDLNGVAIADNKTTTAQGMFAQLGIMANSVKSLGASVVSFVGEQITSGKPAKKESQDSQEGDELNQFLDYQPFPDN